MKLYGFEETEERPTWYVIEEELRKGINVPCIDHVRFGKNEEEIVLISEPYNVDMKEIKELIKFCEIRGLEFEIWGTSVHNPGHTFGICIHCNDDHKNKDQQFWIRKIKHIIRRQNIEYYYLRRTKCPIEIYKEK